MLSTCRHMMANCHKMIKNNPYNPGPYSCLGTLNKYLGHYQQAAHYYNKALEIDPNHDDAREKLELLKSQLEPLSQRSPQKSEGAKEDTSPLNA